MTPSIKILIILHFLPTPEGKTLLVVRSIWVADGKWIIPPWTRRAPVALPPNGCVVTLRAYPLVDFGELELPEPADLVGGEAATLNPPVHRVLGDSEMFGDLVDRGPGLRHVPLHGGSIPLEHDGT